LENGKFPPWELYINSGKLLGEGSWAKVYLAEWRQTTVVAKVLKNSLDELGKQLIIKEFENMTKMHHPNIVQLFGYVEEPFTIVMEYFKNGDLFDNLNTLKLNQKISITKDIIKGLIYIHERKPHGLIHRDIKPRNILLTNSFTAKISDFGLSTFSINQIVKIASNNNLNLLEYDLNNNYTTDVGTERYMAPEVNAGYYNYKIDIYSCGILLYELFTLNIYFKKFNWSNCNIKLKQLILQMTNVKSNERPNANSILNNFNHIEFSKFKKIFL
jgi:serine/threonine protein kinase